MLTQPEGIRFAAVFPVLKALREDDGSRILEGIISDETVDVQGEVIPGDMLAKSYGYLDKWGKVNWEHNHDYYIGEVLEVRKIAADEAAREFGADLVGSGTYSKVRIYPMHPDAPEGLRECHRLIDSGAKLGFSIDGMAVRTPGQNRPRAMLAHQIAVSGQPVNPNVACRVVKSLSAAFDAAEEIAQAGDDAQVVLVQADLPRQSSIPKPITPDPVVYALTKALLRKAVEAGHNINAATMTGGEAIQREQFGNSNNRRGRKGGALQAGPGGWCVCQKCGHEQRHTTAKPCYELKCVKCGATMARKDDAERLERALSALQDVTLGRRRVAASRRGVTST